MIPRVCSVLVVLVVAACDVSDGGEWVRITPPAPASSEFSLGSQGAVLHLDETMTATRRTPFLVCQIPPAVTLNIDPDLAPYYLQDRSHVCIGEPNGHDGLKLCWGVHAAEAHAQAVADCFIAMKKQLAAQGTKVLGVQWSWDLAKPVLPEAWSLSEREVLSWVDRVSNNIADLLNGGGSVEADPLCVSRSHLAKPEDVKTELLDEIMGFCTANGDDIAGLLSAIKRGVNVQVTKDLRLELAAMIVEKESNLEDVGDFYHCSFGK